MTIHFISDLHLCEEQPHLLKLFDVYLNSFATQAEQLFILGDLFEVWIGDDYVPDWVARIEKQLLRLTQNGTEVAFSHGNRDFLIGETFSERTGVKLLQENHLTDLNGHSTLLCHGDALCTDDVAYQKFRREVRTEKWQANFLALPIEQRLTIVNGYRQQSKEATAAKSNDIMDVNEQAVIKAFSEHSVNWMIHGHTHRPALHQHTFDDGAAKNLTNNSAHERNHHHRIVLSDWNDNGQFLALEANEYRFHYFDDSGTVSTDWTAPLS